MPDNLSHSDLVAKIALNSKLTAREIEEALEVLSVVFQQTLQDGGSVDLLGVGTFSVEDRVVNFRAGQSLTESVADPTTEVIIETGVSRQSVYNPDEMGPYKHKVNVC